MRFAFVCGAFALASLGFTQIYNNGPFVTHPGGGASGADESRLQTTSMGMTLLGAGFGQATNVWVADDFTVPTGQTWNITGLSVFGYQTTAPNTNLITDIRVQIFGGGTPVTGSLLFGDTTTNRQSSSAWTNAWRTTETTIGATNRAIIRGNANISLSLGAGTYWVAWAVNASFNPAGAVFGPPVTITGLGQKPGSNALQSTAGGAGATFTTNIVDAGNTLQQDMPFLLHGQVVPEPGTMAAIGIGVAALAARRRRRK